ncbi:hypothetical protein I552_8933 [Mycobacterium xenopi 3993]|nr:hypothetical protein I552_8933 [Mycobacterium xenopi 3993]
MDNANRLAAPHSPSVNLLRVFSQQFHVRREGITGSRGTSIPSSA